MFTFRYNCELLYNCFCKKLKHLIKVFRYYSHLMAINTNCDALATPCLFLQPPYQLCDPYIRCSFRAKHHNTAETLLAVIAAFSAKFVVGNAISFIQKQRPLLFPFLAHSRHSNQSSFPAKT